MAIAKIDKDKSFRNQVIEVLSSPHYAGWTEEKKALKLKIGRDTLLDYRKREDLQKEVDLRLEEYRTKALQKTRQNTPNAYRRLGEQVDTGNVSAIKLHLQVVGDLKEHIEHSGEIKSHEEDLKEEEHVRDMVGFLGSEKLTDSEQETAQ